MSIRDEVRASAAAHRDLGPGYDTAVAEGLVERIGEEIDKRVDARLYSQAPYQSPPPRPRLRREPVPGRIGFGAVVLGLGSMGMAIGATAAVLHPGDSPGQVSGGAAVLIALIWIVIGAINVAYARYRLLSVCYLCRRYPRLICGDPRHAVRCAHEQRPRGGDPRLCGRARRSRPWLRRRGSRGTGRAHRGGNRQTDRRAARTVRDDEGSWSSCWCGWRCWWGWRWRLARGWRLARSGGRWLAGTGGTGVSGLSGAGRVPGISGIPGLHGSHAAARVPDGAAGPAVFGRAA